MWKLAELLQRKQASSTPVSAHVMQSLENSWAHPAMPCSLTDPLGKPPYPDITCGLYLPLFGRLVCGRSDGTIVSLSAAQAATSLLLRHRRFTRGQCGALYFVVGIIYVNDRLASTLYHDWTQWEGQSSFIPSRSPISV